MSRAVGARRRRAAAVCGLLAALGALAGTAPAAQAPATPAYPSGGDTFRANCAVCHGPAGAGVPGLAPPLLTYPARYAGSVEGRRQLALTLLYGMFGEVTVGDQHYDFSMPDFARFDDAALAAVLNFIVFDLDHAAGGVPPLTAKELAAERGQSIDGAAVREHRKAVAPAGP